MTIFLISIVALLGASCQTTDVSSADFAPELTEMVTDQQWSQSNQGREPIRKDGFFAFPKNIRRVWVDVGAYKLKVSKGALKRDPDLAVIAIEPVAEHWKTWPDDPRVIGVPVAISLERGVLDLNMNEADGTNSLLKTQPGSLFAKTVQKTIAVRRVPAVRLGDVLERIPAHISVEFLKTDIQGLDLQALKSAGDQILRVKRIQTEIMNTALYEKTSAESMSSEQEFQSYLGGRGFTLVGEKVTPNREWLDAFYANDRWDQKSLLGRLGTGVYWPGSPPGTQGAAEFDAAREFDWLVPESTGAVDPEAES